METEFQQSFFRPDEAAVSHICFFINRDAQLMPCIIVVRTDARDSNSLATPFALMDKLFGPYAWSNTSKAKINEKLEVYFQEFDLLPLFVQENYLKHKYARANADPGHIAWKKMQLTAQAADSISDGDLVDRMIHGYVSICCLVGEQRYSRLTCFHFAVL